MDALGNAHYCYRRDISATKATAMATVSPAAAAMAVVPVPETHFQFNAIVQNQLPRSWRNIRAKFTAESVLRPGGIGRTCRCRAIPALSILENP